MFYPERLTFFQSKREADSNENILRAYRVWENLPVWMREWAPCRQKFLSMEFSHHNSRILGIPAGAEHLRQFTVSGVMDDEVAYQPDVDKKMAAIGPTLTGGGRYTGISSASASYYSQMVRDEV